MAALTGSSQAADELLLDDFTDQGGLSSFGTRWNGFTDRVMGGRSEMQAGVVETDGGPALRMRGSVRLDNNGGFIQVRLPLEVDGGTLDASDFDGVALEVRGAPGPYFIHLRTPDCRRPWQYYRAELRVTRSGERSSCRSAISRASPSVPHPISPVCARSRWSPTAKPSRPNWKYGAWRWPGMT